MAHNESFEELAALQALGQLGGAEASLFARHREEGCPVCEELLSDFREASSALAVEAPALPPDPRIKERLLAVLATRGRTTPTRTSAFARTLGALAAALLVAIVLTDDFRLRHQREELQSQAEQFSEDLDTARRGLAQSQLRARVLQNEDVKILSLDGKGPQPAACAKVFWSDHAKRGIVVADHLASLQPDKQYELWVFTQGKPMPAGVFDADQSGRALFESADLSGIAAAQNFAVTVEPRGGMPRPTGPIVLVGSS